jgi:hypothetical protein
LRILAIDPGNQQSAYALLDADLRPVKFAKKPNDEVMKDCITILEENTTVVAIEMIASYGMAVGKEVFETCVWIGRFIERLAPEAYKLIYRREEKENLCGSMRAKDSNIRQALIDRFGVVGTKKNPGWFYGVSKDVWAAIAVGVTYHDKVEEERRLKLINDKY